MSKEQRAHQNNGIWLCANCAALVDTDANQYNVQQLHEWKRKAESRARAAVARSGPKSEAFEAFVEMDDAGRQQVTALNLASEETIEFVASGLNAAARLDLNAFRKFSSWPAHPVGLSLRTKLEEETVPLVIQGLANLLGVVRTAVLVSAPGTGKSTTLNQLAEALNSGGGQVAVLCPLAEWAAQSEHLLTWLTQRSAYLAFQMKHFMLLAFHGRLTLLLDGWNELDSASRIRLLKEKERLERDYPLICIALSTRQQAQDAPISGPTVFIDGLTYPQQREIAQAKREEEGLLLLERARHPPGIRELISIPLYFNAIISNASSDKLPGTKEEILRLFVEQQEADPVKAEILKDRLLSLHRRFLEALAVAAMDGATTVLDENHARSAIANIQKQLEKEGQMGAPLQPAVVLNTLVDHGSLVRVGNDKIAFEHSQFLEWHASFTVERLAKLISGDAPLAERLAEHFLNHPVWEESVLFACERMATAGDVETPAQLIRRTLSIDPLFAAEMIFRSGGKVWELVKDEVMGFVARWHRPKNLDRAVRFMVASGRPEFSDELWQLLTLPDPQNYFSILRYGSIFRLSVLGGQVEDRIAGLPEETRSHFLGEIVSEAGVEGIELATKIGKKDPSLTVQRDLIGHLHFRGANRQIMELLSGGSGELWKTYALCAGSEKMADPVVAARLQTERENRIKSEIDPIVKIGLLLAQDPLPTSTADDVATVIRDGDFSRFEFRWAPTIGLAQEKFPEAVNHALVERFCRGRDIPHPVDETLKKCAATEDERLFELLLNPKTEKDLSKAIAKIIGPGLVGKLLDLFLPAAYVKLPTAVTIPSPRTHECCRLRDLLLETRLNSLIPALLRRKRTKNSEQISGMVELIARHGRALNSEPLEGDSDKLGSIAQLFPSWAEQLIAEPTMTRERLAELAIAIGRIPRPELLAPLLRLKDEDPRRQKLSMAQRKWGDSLTMETNGSYAGQYDRALAAIGDNETVLAMQGRVALTSEGVDAARVLQKIWAKRHPTKGPRGHMPWSNFSLVTRLREAGEPTETELSDSYSSVFWEVLSRLKPTNEEEQRHAMALGGLALTMPSRGEAEIVADLINLPLPTRQKFFFVLQFVLSGREVASEVLMKAIKELAADSINQRWIVDEQHGELERWLELFPFSDQPELLFAALDQSPRHVLRPSRLRGLLVAICAAPWLDREGMVRRLAQREPEFYRDDEWVEALFWCTPKSARRNLLDDVIEGRMPGILNGTASWRVQQGFKGFLAGDFVFRSEVYQRLRGNLEPAIHSFFLGLIAEAPDTDAVFFFLGEYAKTGKSLDGHLHQVLEGVVLEKDFISSSHPAYQLRSVDASLLRQRLFALAISSSPQAPLAGQCLEAIDEIRDEHGRIDTEPRHPDIASGRAWPAVCATVS